MMRVTALVLVLLLSACADSVQHSPDAEEKVTIEQVWKADTWVNAHRTATLEDSLGRPIRVTNANYHGKGWTVEDRKHLLYADTQLPIAIFSEHYARDGWRASDSTMHQYDAAGRLEQSEVLAWMWSDARWVPAKRIVYEYDDTGLLRTQLTLRPFYDSDGEQVVLAAANEAAWHHQEMTTLTYNAEGQVHTETLVRWRNNQWQPRERKTHTYDGGQCTSTTIETWRDDAWQPDVQQRYAYDAKGALTETVREKYAGAIWLPLSRTIVANF